MGTRSLIARQIGPDEYRTVFCQTEGHLECQGAILAEHFTNPDQVDRLLDLGDLHRLGAKMEPGGTVALRRDRQCANTEPEINTLENLDSSGGMIEFVYIFDQDNRWKYFQGGYLDDGLRDVKADLEALEQGIDILKGPRLDFCDPA